jgi:hypothetical protein
MASAGSIALFAGALLCVAGHVPAIAQTPAGAAPSAPAVIAIRAGTLFDGTGANATSDVTILVRDGRIAEVGRNVTVPADAQRIDLSGWTVMPGFIDLHTHITGNPEDLTSPPGSFLYSEYPEYAV